MTTVDLGVLLREADDMGVSTVVAERTELAHGELALIIYGDDEAKNLLSYQLAAVDSVRVLGHQYRLTANAISASLRTADSAEDDLLLLDDERNPASGVLALAQHAAVQEAQAGYGEVTAIHGE
ncbi:hypothetical protein [Natronosalvus rutilus]|uniref:Uncharacterized protein n=1 Tax=Natronosalvus rutilus TaxID=2953753 RepID=A0A9E7SW07_9EURY|nr:hypothetical protein [Natronosalvus rutilus]UTF52768.1 hypothetical protein NGM29_13375 [Natronosalvus rutilus]